MSIGLAHTTIAPTKTAVLKIPDKPIMPPTRQCLICDELENPKADIVNTSYAWLCQECKRRLKKMLYVEESE